MPDQTQPETMADRSGQSQWSGDPFTVSDLSLNIAGIKRQETEDILSSGAQSVVQSTFNLCPSEGDAQEIWFTGLQYTQLSY